MYFILLLYYLFSTGSSLDRMEHDIHLSKTEVHYNEDHHSLEISMHVFVDDLEAAMNLMGFNDLYLTTSREHKQADRLIMDYLNRHFKVFVNSQRVTFNLLGREDSEDLLAVWCYLEGEKVPIPVEIRIENTLLTDLYSDQKNLLVFMGLRKREFFLFDQKIQNTVIKF